MVKKQPQTRKNEVLYAFQNKLNKIILIRHCPGKRGITHHFSRIKF